MKLGPEGFKNIAICGSAPSSLMLAPFKDQAWSIWCVSPAVYPQAPRSDVWFELHRFFPAYPGGGTQPGTRPWFSPEFTAFLTQYKGTLFMSAELAQIPNAKRFPFEEKVDRYGPYHFNSSVSWMLAHAIDTILAMREAGTIGKDEGKIGLWGIDMAASEEYAYQRPSCQHFIGMAVGLGIEVILPPESDLMRPPLMYGLGEQNPRHIKLIDRLEGWKSRSAMLSQQAAQIQGELSYLKGAQDATEYVIQSWCDDVEVAPAKALTMAVEFAKKKKRA